MKSKFYGQAKLICCFFALIFLFGGMIYNAESLEICCALMVICVLVADYKQGEAEYEEEKQAEKERYEQQIKDLEELYDKELHRCIEFKNFEKGWKK